MLRLEKATLGKFGAQDMMSLITSQGWEAILPDALHDNHLLLMSDQIRDLLSGDGWNDDDPEPSSAALPLTLLLLTKAIHRDFKCWFSTPKRKQNQNATPNRQRGL